MTKKFDRLTSRAIVFFDFDTIAVDFLKQFRLYFYNTIMIQGRLYPTEFTYDTLQERAILRKFVQYCLDLDGRNFWLESKKYKMFRFYYMRFKKTYNKLIEDPLDRIMFICSDDFYDIKMQFKEEWYPDIPMIKISEKPDYKVPHMLVTRNLLLQKEWNWDEKYFLVDFGKTVVADYYVLDKIVPHLKKYSGLIFNYEIPHIRVPHPTWKTKVDIVSVPLEDLLYLPEHVKINE